MHVEDPPLALVIDAEGRFVHDGTVVTHARLVALLHRSIARNDDGTYVVTTGRDRVPLIVEDTPYFVRTLKRTTTGAVDLVLSDDTHERVDEKTSFVVDSQDRMRVRIKGDRFWAKLLRPAHAALTDGVLELPGPSVVARPLGGPIVNLVEAAAGIDWTR